MPLHGGVGVHREAEEAAGNRDNVSRQSLESATPARAPSDPVIPHRLGNTTTHLSESQPFSPEAEETAMLYKKLKHKSVNTLHRFVVFLLCLLSPSFFCHAFGMGSSEWLITTHRNHLESIGFFVACRETLVGVCTRRTSSAYVRVLRDELTGDVVCEASESFVHGYIGAMWALGIMQVVCILFTILTALRIALRPTRSCSSLLAMCFLGVAVPCGIINCVLFHFYTQCDRRGCEAMHLESPTCRVQYEWGYRIHIVATCLDFCAFITAFCLWVYPHTIRSHALHLLVQRREREREKARQRERSMNSERSGVFDRLLRTMRGSPEGLSYLTAAELGVVIDGAVDWVYDHKSDLFYSFQLDMFWDPLTQRYYSRALQSWQAAPDGLTGGLYSFNTRQMAGV